MNRKSVLATGFSRLGRVATLTVTLGAACVGAACTQPQGASPSAGEIEGLGQGGTAASPPPLACTLSADPAEQPYGGHASPIPGAVEAEAYDEGGEGIGFHDLSPGNEGGALRDDDVDLKAMGDGYGVGWWQAGEWLAYTVDVAQAGDYRFEFRVGSPEAGRTLALYACGTLVASDVAVPVVADWGLTGVVSATVPLLAGRQVLRVVLGPVDYADFDGFSVTAEPGSGSGGSGGAGGGEPVGGFGAVVAGVRPRGPQCGAYTRTLPATGTEYFVAAEGSDSALGTSAAPFRTLQHAADVAHGGDVVTIRPGEYVGSVIVTSGGSEGAPVTFQAEQCGTAVLTGDGDYSFRADSFGGDWQSCTQQYVTLKGLAFREYARREGDPQNCHGTTVAVGMCTGWRVEDCSFERAGDRSIAAYGSNIVVTRSRIAESYGYSIIGAGDGNAHIHDLEFSDLVLQAGNATGLLHPACGASVKILYSDRVSVDNIESFDNVGPGWWFDWENYDWQIRNSYFHDNHGKDADWQGPGVWLEGPGGGGLAEHNVFRGNAGPGLGVLESHDHTLRNNLFAENGIEIRGIEDGARQVPTNIHILDNYFRLAGTYTSIGAFAGKTPAGQGFVVDGNTYQIGGPPLFQWGDEKAFTVAEMQSKFGLEANGAEAPVPWPPAP